jgi:hypothetical protein
MSAFGAWFNISNAWRSLVKVAQSVVRRLLAVH